MAIADAWRDDEDGDQGVEGMTDLDAVAEPEVLPEHDRDCDALADTDPAPTAAVGNGVERPKKNRQSAGAADGGTDKGNEEGEGLTKGSKQGLLLRGRRGGRRG